MLHCTSRCSYAFGNSLASDLSASYLALPKRLSTLEKYGVAVIPSVFTELETKDLLDKMWSFFEHITKKFKTPIKRDKPETWKSFYSLYPLHAMLIQRFGIGHAQFAWDARQNIKAVEIFSELWSVEPEDLLVSFDGSSFHLPPETTNRGWNRNNTWYHSDQSFTRNDFECAQSFVTLNDINVGDGTLAFMEGSHKYHQDTAKKFKLEEKGFEDIKVFTTRPETIFGAAFLGLSFDHPLSKLFFDDTVFQKFRNDAEKFTVDETMLDKIFNDFKKNKLSALMLTASEPLLYKHFDKVLKRAEEAEII